MRLRVVWGLSETMPTLRPTSAFNSVVLPTLGAPTKETKPQVWEGALTNLPPWRRVENKELRVKRKEMQKQG